MNQQTIFSNTRLVNTTQQSIERVRQALRQERSSIISYFQNYTIENNQERTYYQRLVQQISKMTLSLNKVLYLKKQEEILSSMIELYQTVGINLTNINRNWQNNHTRLLQEYERYNTFYHELLDFGNSV